MSAPPSTSLRLASRALGATVWASSLVFGLYILAFFFARYYWIPGIVLGLGGAGA